VRFLKVTVPILLAGLILYLVFRNVDFQEFWKNLEEVDYSWVILSIFLSVIAYISRAFRWNLLLQPIGYPISLYRGTLIILVAYLANLALPRIGEIVRCGLLKRTNQVPVNISLGTVITERVVDLFTLIALIIVALLVEFDILWAFLQESLLLDARLILLICLVAILIGLGGLWLGVKMVQKGRFPKIQVFVEGLRDGILSLLKINRPIAFLFSTLILWTVYYLMSYTIIFSLSTTSHLDLSAGLLLLVVGGIAISLPVQSGFGTYHAMIAGLLLVYGIEETTGVFLATLLHTSQIIAVVIFGSLALLAIFLIGKKYEANSG